MSAITAVCALVCLCTSQAAPQNTANPNPLALALQRIHPASYIPGQPVEVVINIQAGQPGDMTAMGLRETLPEGWTLQDVGGLSGAPPDIAPQPGVSGLLEFAWITVPPLPYSFSYTLLPPEGDSGEKFIHGALEYRQMGGANYAPPAMTSLKGPAPETPTITLRGANPMTVTVGAAWREPGYTAVDTKNNDVSAKVTVEGAVDTSRAGTYSVQYSINSSDGLKTTTATRTVNVVEGQSAGEGETPAAPSGNVIAPGGPNTAEDSRTRSNPIAESAGKNPVKSNPAKPPDAGAASTETAHPDLPDLSAFRPVTPEQGAQKAMGGAGSGTSPGKAPKISLQDLLEQRIHEAEKKLFSNTAVIPTKGNAATFSPSEKKNTMPPENKTSGQESPAEPPRTTVMLLPLAAAIGTTLVLIGLLFFLAKWVYGRPARRRPPGKRSGK